MSTVRQHVYSLTEADWMVDVYERPCLTVPECIRPWQTDCNRSYFDFIGAVSAATFEEGNTWLLCAEDFSENKQRAALRWDALRTMGISSAGDEKERRRIEDFWEQYLPICISAGTINSFCALGKNGEVVIGYEPLYEEAKVVSDDFDQFVDMLAAGEVYL